MTIKSLNILFAILFIGFSFETKGQKKRTASYAIASNAGLYVSVKDYGAKGDGLNDDTDAIQKALDFASNNSYSFAKIDGVYEVDHIYVGGIRTVFFPLGVYKISKPLKVGAFGHILGDKCILLPDEGHINKFNAIDAWGWQLQIEGIQFVRFSNAITIDNHNADAGKVVINNCDFYNNVLAIQLNAKSSLTIIRENRFYRNDRALDIIFGDKVDMIDNWITSGNLKGTHDAQIINRGILHFDKNLLVPLPPQNGAIEPAWINNYELVTVTGTRQGGEPGSFTLVNNFAKADETYPLWPNGVIVTNSDCFGVYGTKGDHKVPAVLRIINLPNNIVLENIRGLAEARALDFTTLKSAKDNSNRNAGLKEQLIHVRVENLQGSPFPFKNGTLIPDELLKYIPKNAPTFKQ